MNRRVCCMRYFIGLLFLFALPVSAASFYQQQVEQAEVSKKVMKKALKQVKEHKDIKVVDEMFVPPFHKRGQLQSTQKQSVCLTCHKALPHRKSERSRTFMNMHSRYIACETCHLRPKKRVLDYQWLAFDGVDAGLKLPPRVTLTEPVAVSSKIPKEKQHARQKHQQEFKKKLPLAPQAGARITPFFDNKPAIEFKDNTFAQTIKDQWDEKDEQKRAELKAKLHAPLEKKGPSCSHCHGKRKVMLNLEALGAAPQRLRELQTNTIVRFFERFKKEDDRIRINKLLR